MKGQFIILFLLCGFYGLAQPPQVEYYRDSLYNAGSAGVGALFQNYTDSLHRKLQLENDDSIRAMVMTELSNNYKFSKPDSAVYFARKAILLAQKLNDHNTEMSALSYYALTEIAIGNHAKAVQLGLLMIKLSERYKLPFHTAMGKQLLGWSYYSSKQYSKAISSFDAAHKLFATINNETMASMSASFLADTHSIQNQYDSAIYYSSLAENYSGRATWTVPFVALHISRVYANMSDYAKALRYAHTAKLTGGKVEVYWSFLATLQLANLHRTLDNADSALYYGYEALFMAKDTRFYSNIIEANLFLSANFESIDIEKALLHSENAFLYKDSLSQLERSMAIEDFESLDQEQRQLELDQAREDFQNRLKMNALLGSSFTLLVVAFVLFRSRRAKQKAKTKIEKAYSQLEATQSQLIQSEKMASLGELTAGIAHEIQNPLNFVNNFSDVNKELLEELKEEIKKGNGQEAEAILKDIMDNEEKILHHGKRADGIVKGMLQHSRSSGGKKELTDINELSDEYLRLAYHGLRAKDKSFNAYFRTELDPNLPKINVAPQDIGRVLLNLINNAFFAVSQKSEAGSEGYKPTVMVSTKHVPLGRGIKGEEYVEIRIKDNGPGIPEDIKDKIFQPFFTTKSTGEGTGLGLSLSYDIVTKGHGGELKIETSSSDGTTFLIILPD